MFEPRQHLILSTRNVTSSLIDERLLRGIKDYRPGKKFTSVYYNYISSSDIIYDIGRPNQ